MKSSYSICYGTSLETERPPLETMPLEQRCSSEMGKILLDGLDALAAIDTSPDSVGIISDRAVSAGTKKGRRSKHDTETAHSYKYVPSAEVRIKFARLSENLISAMSQATVREELHGTAL